MIGGKLTMKELDKATKGGIFALAQETKNGPFQMKVGRTIDFKKRLDQYHLCFNSGFKIIALLPLKNRTKPENRLKLSMELEKHAGEMLGKPRTYLNRKSRGSEWYFKSVHQIHNVFKELHNTFKVDANHFLTEPPMLKFDDNFINIFDVEGVKVIKKYEVKASNHNFFFIKKNVKMKDMKKMNMVGFKKKSEVYV